MANSPLKTAEWLTRNLAKNPAKNSGPDKLVILDASWHLPDSGRDALAEFHEAHIPGARFFDINKVVDPLSDQPHTLPKARDFAAAVKLLGINNGSKIIVYDNSDFRTAARAWWMFRAMGHKNVYVLDGGFQLWQAKKLRTQRGGFKADKSVYYAEYNEDLYLTKDDILANIDLSIKDKNKWQIVDARAEGRYLGTAPEPRAGLRSGHIPGALNLPFSELYGDDGTLLDNDALFDRIETAGIDPDRPIGTSCGSGITACSLALAFAKLGKWDTPIYDGSWSEWGADTDLPIETAPTPSEAAL